jgi:hypothetical protein
MVRAGDRKERGGVGKRTNSYSDLGILSGGRSKNCNRGNSVMQAFPNPTRPISYELRDCSTLQSLPFGDRPTGIELSDPFWNAAAPPSRLGGRLTGGALAKTVGSFYDPYGRGSALGAAPRVTP